MTNHLHTIESYLTQIAFRGNQNLRVQGTVISYTDEMIDELIKCKLDPCYFISKYIKVIHPDKGMVTMELFDYQNKMINTYKDNRKVVFLTARQQGKCVSLNSNIKIRQKSTGKIFDITIGEFYEWQKFDKLFTEETLQELRNRI